MRNRVPVKREVALEFTPVPRKYRHDGWTPERQKAFIEALADTGSVTRAAAQVNMAQANCYTLRRAPGAEDFRRAWEAALDFGVKRLKDIAFERAIDGQLVPVFVAGKLMGFRRKRNDALLMFCLRHYGEDAEGRRVTVNYFSTRATASAGSGQASTGSGQALAGAGAGVSTALDTSGEGTRAVAGAEASTTSVRTVVSGRGAGSDGPRRLDRAAETLNGFGGVALDARAEREIRLALEACAQRSRDAEAAYETGGIAAEDAAAGDVEQSFFRSAHPYRGELVPGIATEDVVSFAAGEDHWRLAGAEMPPEWAAVAEALEAQQEGRDEKRRLEDRRRYRARKARRAAEFPVAGSAVHGGEKVDPGSSPG